LGCLFVEILEDKSNQNFFLVLVSANFIRFEDQKNNVPPHPEGCGFNFGHD